MIKQVLPLLLLASGPLMAQLPTPGGLSSGSSSGGNSNIKAFWTLGDLVVGLSSASNLHVLNSFVYITGVPNGIEEHLTPFSINVYPNPFSYQLHIQADGLAGGHELTYAVADMFGRTVYSATTQQSLLTADLSLLAQRSYLVTVTSPSKLATYLIVKTQ